MKVISVHSHKGGAGKTTLTLMMAKAQAMAGKRVCAVDIDFIGSGFEHLLDVPAPAKYLDDYITQDPGSPQLPKIEEMVTSYSDQDLRKRSLDLIFNSAGSRMNNLPLGQPKAVRILQSIAPRQDIAGRAVVSLLMKLSEKGYDLVLLDCHPGLAHLSESLLRIGNRSEYGEHVFLFVTTANRAHFYGLINELNTLASLEYGRLFNPKLSVLCLNRAHQALGEGWKDLIAFVRERETVHPEESGARLSTFEKICGGRGALNFLLFPELSEVSVWDSLGGTSEIVRPDIGNIHFSDTRLCRSLF